MLASKLGAETGRMALGRAVWAGERDKSIRQTIINVAGGFALIVDTRLFDILVSLFPLLFSSLSLSLSLLPTSPSRFNSAMIFSRSLPSFSRS